MSEERSRSSPELPDTVRELHGGLCEDVAALQLKMSFYRELFSNRANAELLSSLAPAFFQVVAESLRNDIVLGICRLSDPSRSLVGDNRSLAALVGKCPKVPKAEFLLTAFQSACGIVRMYRNQQLGHNDVHSKITPHDELIPSIEIVHVEEILRLAGEVLRAIHPYDAHQDFRVFAPGFTGAGDLIRWLRLAKESDELRKQDLRGSSAR
jgi:hypothetical protein